MAAHNELGAQGEYEALLYLTKQGYTLLAHNWRVGHLELDIVAEQWGEIVFVEVKTQQRGLCTGRRGRDALQKAKPHCGSAGVPCPQRFAGTPLSLRHHHRGGQSATFQTDALAQCLHRRGCLSGTQRTQG